MCRQNISGFYSYRSRHVDRVGKISNFNRPKRRYCAPGRTVCFLLVVYAAARVYSAGTVVAESIVLAYSNILTYALVYQT